MTYTRHARLANDIDHLVLHNNSRPAADFSLIRNASHAQRQYFPISQKAWAEAWLLAESATQK